MGKEERKIDKVYILTESYKDNDPEISGVYDSIEAACRGFADRIAAGCVADIYPGPGMDIPPKVEEAARASARTVARLLPTLIGSDFGDDECRDGRTVYGLMEETLESVEEDEEEEA